jgi:hypothetical protein
MAVWCSGIGEALKTSGCLSVGITGAPTDRAEPVMGLGCIGSGGAHASASCGAFGISTA